MSKNSTVKTSEIKTIMQELEKSDKISPFEVFSRNKIGHTMEITSVVELPNGNIMSASKDKTVRIWDRNSGKCLKIFIDNDSRLMRLLPKNRFISTGSSDSKNNQKGQELNDKLIFVKNITTGKILQQIGPYSKSINVLEVQEDKVFIASSQEICLWSLVTGEKLINSHFSLRWQEINCLTPISDGRLVFGTRHSDRKGGKVSIWNIDKEKIIASHYKHNDNVNAVVEWGNKIISASKDRTIRIWEPNENKNQTILRGHYASINALALLPDGRIVSGSGDDYYPGDNTIRIWSQETNECLRVLKGHSARINCLTITSDGKIISGSADKTIRIWNPETGKCLLILGEQPPAVTKILFEPSEREFIVSAMDLNIKESTTDLYSLNTGIVIRSLASGAFSRGMTFLPDGRYVSIENEAISIRSPSGYLLKTIPTKVTNNKTLIVLPNGNIVTAHQKINVWSPNTGRCIKKIATHKEVIVLLALIAGDKLLSTSADGTRLWSTQTWRRLKTYLNKGFGTAYLLPDGQLLTIKDDRKKYFAIWSLKTGKLVKKAIMDIPLRRGYIGRILREAKEREKEFAKDFDIERIIKQVIGNEEIDDFVEKSLHHVILFPDGRIITFQSDTVRVHASNKTNTFKEFVVPNIKYSREIKTHPEGWIIAKKKDLFLLLDSHTGRVMKKFENVTFFDINTQGLFLVKTGKNKIAIWNKDEAIKTFEVEFTNIQFGYFLNNNSIIVYGKSTKDKASIILVSDPEQQKWIYELRFIDVTTRSRWRRYPKIEHNLFSEKIVQLIKKNTTKDITKKNPPDPSKKDVETKTKNVNKSIIDFMSGVQKLAKSKSQEVRTSPKTTEYQEVRNATEKLIGHEEAITSICIDQKGRIVTSAQDETIRFWCPQTGKCFKCLNDSGKYNKILRVSPQNQIIRFPRNTNTKDATIKIYDIDKEKQRKIIFPKGFKLFQISPNNKIVLLDQHDHLFKAIDIATGKVSDILQNFYSKRSYYRQPKQIEPSVFLMPDKTIITANKTGKFRSWEWDTEFFLVKDSLQTYRGHTTSLNAISQLPDGRIISGAQDGTIRLWDPETGECLKTIKFHEKEFSLKVLEDGRVIIGITGIKDYSLDQQADLWILDPQTEELVAMDQKIPMKIDNMKILDNKLILVHLENGGLCLYSCKTLEMLGNLKPNHREEKLIGLGMVDEDKIAIFSNYLGTISVWSLKNQREEVIFYPPKSMKRSKLQQINYRELDQVSVRLKDGHRLHSALTPYNEFFGVSFEVDEIIMKIIDQKKQEVKKEPGMIDAVKELVESFCSSFNLLSVAEKSISEKHGKIDYFYLTRPLKSGKVIFTTAPINHKKKMDKEMISLTIPLLTDEQLDQRREWSAFLELICQLYNLKNHLNEIRTIKTLIAKEINQRLGEKGRKDCRGISDN